MCLKKSCNTQKWNWENGTERSLQFEYDTMLRGFELASGLCVNLCKKNYFGFNLNKVLFMEAASNFLSCSIGSTPYKFLGIPIESQIQMKKMHFYSVSKAQALWWETFMRCWKIIINKSHNWNPIVSRMLETI